LLYRIIGVEYKDHDIDEIASFLKEWVRMASSVIKKRSEASDIFKYPDFTEVLDDKKYNKGEKQCMKRHSPALFVKKNGE